MAKKFVRGITGIKEINKQDFCTNNVNDILSDGENNYIHRKKGNSEEYHNLTDNIKTISSDNTDLLTVTNNNKTNNTATLSPKHDAQKEQVIESQDMTLTITPAANNTSGKTDVRVNPTKVLLQGQLEGMNGITVYHEDGWWGTQVKISDDFVNKVNNKQDTLTSNASIGVVNNTLQQLYSWYETYTHDNGVLKTHVKGISNNTSIHNGQEEFNFILKINQGQQSATFTLNEHDKRDFNSIITTYGVSNSVRINGVLFELSDSTLTVTTDANTGSNLVITFSDII